MADPCVSVGMPVYNGERFLGRAVDTLIGQDLESLELVISDNGSTDGTEEICRSYARADRRVRYERHDVNRGAAWNYTNVLRIANPSARYFAWAAADDEHDAAYLTRTVALLDDDPTASLAHTGTADIDDEGFVIKRWHEPFRRLASRDPGERLFDLATMRHECFEAFGVIRHDVAKVTRGLLPFSDADHILLAEIALRGRMLHDDEILFFRRQHPERSMAAFVHARHRNEWFDPGKADTLTFPTWRIGAEYLRAIREAPLTSAERRSCYLSMRAFVACNWPDMAKNLVGSALVAPTVLRRQAARRTP
jgi:glycosyltransferase involved in cell wall biosynthesis